MNNLLVHISLSRDQGKRFNPDGFGTMLQRTAKRSKRYAMKIHLSSAGEASCDYEYKNYTVTYNELPGLCKGLLWAENCIPGRLASTKLRLIIADEVGIDGARVKEDNSTETRNEKTSGTTSSRVRKLLEPLRRLHSINDLRILGPLSEKYKAAVIADISRFTPSFEDIFNYARISLEKAIGHFDSGDFASSIIELKNAIDEVHNAALHRDIRLSPRSDFITRPYKITTGPYAGYNLCDASLAVRVTLVTKLARAYLKIGDIDSAEIQLVEIITLYRYTSSYPRIPIGGDDAIMISNMVSQIREERNRVGNDESSYPYFLFLAELSRPLARFLKESLRHEPENKLLAQEVKKRDEEVTMNDEV